MRFISFIVALVLVAANASHAQTSADSIPAFIPLYKEGAIPNCTFKVTDSIADERIHRVDMPGMWGFLPSAANNKGVAVLICPGGGYQRVGHASQYVSMARWYNSIGVAVFILKYRLPNAINITNRSVVPLQDAQRGLQIIRSRAREWNIDPNRIGAMGTSAGGHLAAWLSLSTTHVVETKEPIDTVSFHPNFAVLISPVIDLGEWAHKGSRNNLLGPNADTALIRQYSLQYKVHKGVPPTFLVHAFDDKSVNSMNSVLYYQSLLANNVTSSLHIFPQGAHAISIRNNPGTTQSWPMLCEGWLREMNILPPAK